ncbi:MAG TPA: GNAT family N-acetyltransferase, partial [Actinomycetota bacterium]
LRLGYADGSVVQVAGRHGLEVLAGDHGATLPRDRDSARPAAVNMDWQTAVVRIVSRPEGEVPHELRLQMVMLQDQAWPSDCPPDTTPWHDQSLNPLSVLLLDDDDGVVSALDILSKQIAHRGKAYSASGISAMVTDQGLRGHGYGRMLATAAREMMGSSGADLGIFTCDAHLQQFYEAAGWQHLPGTVLIGGTPADPFPSDQFDKVTLGCFFSAKAKDARAEFVGARIELFSGEIDKLW